MLHVWIVFRQSEGRRIRRSSPSAEPSHSKEIPIHHLADLPVQPRSRRIQQALLIAGIVAIALNLRPALTGVGPLIADIRQDTGLSNTLLGLLTTLPLLAFGFVSAFTPLATRRLGLERTLAAALGALAAGILLRGAPSVLLLYLGTAVLGTAIAFGNVLLPSIVKRDFPARTGSMTGIYSSAMGIGATIGAGVSVPLALVLGWRGSLAVWAIPALAALLLWLPQTHQRTPPFRSRTIRQSLRHLGGSRIAWFVALFMGLQSLTFYVIIAWLPEILQSRGHDAAFAGWMLALSQGTGILGTMIVPTWAGRLRDQRPLVWMLGLMEAGSLAGMLIPVAAIVPIWVSLLGFIMGGTFGLALLLIVLRTDDSETATELSGMAQSIGYLLAAAGPLLFGLLYDLMRGWTGPILFLVATMVAKVVTGLGAGRPLKLRP